MTYKLLAQKLLGEKQFVPSISAGYYYGSTEDVPANPFNEIRVDSSFLARVNDNVFDILVLQDGSTLVSGIFTNVNGASTSSDLIKFRPDGSRDTTFPDVFVNGYISSIAQQSTGEIIIAGNFTTVQTGPNVVTTRQVARLSTSGYVDTTFLAPEFAGDQELIRKVVVLLDDRIVVLGSFATVDLTSRPTIARLKSNGSWDTTFTPDWSGGTGGGPRDIFVQSDGKLLIGGDFTGFWGANRMRITRLNLDDSPDGTFNPYINDGEVRLIKQQADGKIMIAGTFKIIDVDVRIRLARLNLDGSIDTTFEQNVGEGDLTVTSGTVVSMGFQSDGKIIIGGTFNLVNGEYNFSLTSMTGTPVTGLVRLHTDGTLDESFSAELGSTIQGYWYATVNQIAVTSGDLIYIGGAWLSVNGNTDARHFTRLKKTTNNAPYTEVYDCDVPSVIVESIFVSNHMGYMNSVDIAVLPASETVVSERHHVVWDYFIDKNDYAVFRPRIPLNAGDRIFAYSTVDEPMSVNIFGQTI